MATAARELVVSKGKVAPKKRRYTRTEKAAVASRKNGELGGRPQWEPEPQRVQNAAGLWEDETQEQAWNRARQVVRHYTAIGYPAEVICRLVEPPCSETTLKAHFQHELTNGRLIQDAKMAGTVYQLGVSGRDPASARFWVRARLGWRDTGDMPSSGMDVQFTKIEGDDW